MTSPTSSLDLPAFPAGITSTPAGDVCHGLPGMSLRAWLLGQALAGLCANANLLDHLRAGDDIDDANFAASVVGGAAAMADAALRKLEAS